MIRHERWRHLWLAALTASACIGPGLSHGKVYLFHIVLVLAWAWLLLRDRAGALERLKRLEAPVRWFLLVFAGWALLGLAWAPDRSSAMAAIVRAFIGYGLLLALLLLVRDRRHFAGVATVAGITLGAELLLDLFEVFTPMRWPISRYSDLAHLFGRTNDLFELSSDPKVAAYLETSPTGFHWNPNDMCVCVMALVPFAWHWSRRWLGTLVTLAVLLVVIAAGARLIYLALAIMAVAGIYFNRSRWNALALLAAMVLLSTNVFRSNYSSEKKLREVQVFSRMLAGVDVDKAQLQRLGDLDKPEGSTGDRKALLRLGLRSVKDTRGRGLGIGGSSPYLTEHWAKDRKPVTDLHNWWIEVLAEGGVFLFAVYMLWLGWLSWGTWKAHRTGREPLAAPLLLLLVAFVPAAVAPSSIAYLLPMYILLALLILTRDPLFHARPEAR